MFFPVIFVIGVAIYFFSGYESGYKNGWLENGLQWSKARDKGEIVGYKCKNCQKDNN